MRLGAAIRAFSVYLKLCLLKHVRGSNCSFTLYNHVGKNVSLYFDKDSTVDLGRHIGLRDNVCLSVRKDASIILGNGVFLNNNCQIVSHNLVKLGDNVRCGQNTMFFDHDYNYRSKQSFRDHDYLSKAIIVGEGTWIGAGSIILKGTIIGKNCVIGAGSVVKGNVPDNSILIQKRAEEIRELYTD